MKKMLFIAILFIILGEMLGAAASTVWVERNITEVYKEIGPIYIKGYVTNPMPNKVVDKVNGFQAELKSLRN